MAQSRYFQINPIRRQQNTQDVQRGLQIGQEIGKLIGGVAGAVKSAQADAAANALMTGQNIANQPGAGQTQDLGKLPSDGSGDGSGGPQPGSPQPQDLGTAPIDQFNNPATGDIQPTQQVPGEDDTQLQQAIAAARLGSGPTVGSVGGPQPGGPQPASQTAGSVSDLNQAIATSRLSQPGGSNFTLNPSNYSSGSTGAGTVGGLTFTGGVAGMKLQQEFQKTQAEDQMNKLKLASAQRQATNEQQEDSGTGRFALDAAMRRVKLAQAQQDLLNAGKSKTAEVKNPPAVNIGSEPVVDQGQLNRHIDGIYGTGTANDIAGSLNEPAMIDDPAHPGTQIPNPNPNAPAMSADGNSVTVGPAKHRVTLQLSEAQIYARQANALRIKQGLPPYPVPGEDPTLGSSAANPYPTTNNLQIYSRPHGSWVRLPNKKVAQVP